MGTLSSTRIAELTAVVLTNTAKIDDYLESHGLPSPSFAVEHPADLGIPPEAIDIDNARNAALEASIELQDPPQGPTSLLRPVVCYFSAKHSASPKCSPIIKKNYFIVKRGLHLNGTSLHAIYKYEIAFNVPVHGSVSFALLAARCNISKPDLQRILRFAMVWHRVFCEPESGFVAHTAASR